MTDWILSKLILTCTSVATTTVDVDTGIDDIPINSFHVTKQFESSLVVIINDR